MGNPKPATDYDPYAILSDAEYLNRRQQTANERQAQLERTYAKGEIIGAQDNNHQIVGKLAYLLFALTSKMETPMWENAEIETARKIEGEANAKSALELKNAREIYEEMKERGATAQTLRDYHTHLHLLRWNAAPACVNTNTSRMPPHVLPCIPTPPSRYDASKRVESIVPRQYQQSLDSQNSAIAFVHLKVTKIIEATGGFDFWILLPDSQRREIWKACWNQYPLYAFLRFRSVEGKVLDLATIYAGEANEECLRLRTYFEVLWVEMCEVVFLYRVAVEDDVTAQEREVAEAWKKIPLSRMVFGLGVPDEWSLSVKEVGVAVEKSMGESGVSETREEVTVVAQILQNLKQLSDKHGIGSEGGVAVHGRNNAIIEEEIAVLSKPSARGRPRGRGKRGRGRGGK